MATEKQWEQLTREGTAILNNPLAEIERLNTQLRQAQERADRNYRLYQELRRETDKAIRAAEQAIKRTERVEALAGYRGEVITRMRVQHENWADELDKAIAVTPTEAKERQRKGAP